MGNPGQAFMKSILHILLKSQTQNYHPSFFGKRMGGWEDCVICIEKGGHNNFAQVTTIIGNLYWKDRLVIKKR